jgi:hypothetical protein
VELSPKHVKKNFNCGYKSLNDYIQNFAKQDVHKGLSICYVLVDDSNNNVMGYYTLSSSSIPKSDFPEELSRKIPYNDVPVALLGRLAVDEAYKGNSDFIISCVNTEASKIISEPYKKPLTF